MTVAAVRKRTAIIIAALIFRNRTGMVHCGKKKKYSVSLVELGNAKSQPYPIKKILKMSLPVPVPPLLYARFTFKIALIDHKKEKKLSSQLLHFFRKSS